MTSMMGDAAEPVRPRVVVSECLGFAAVRYNGQILKSRFVEALGDHVDFLQICPEVEIGLGVPRDPIRIEEEGTPAENSGPRPRAASDADSGESSTAAATRLHLIQPSTGRDLTRAMSDFSSSFLAGLQDVDGFILKSKSPSCALRDSKVYRAGSEGGPLRRGPGFFGRAVIDAYPWAAAEDEGRLTNLRLRHRFLTHLWALARLRRVERSGKTAELVRYHTSYKFLLMSLGPEVPARLGRVVANPDRKSLPELVGEYRSVLGEVLAAPPRTGNTINALQHVFGYVSEGLSGDERSLFLEMLEEFRHERLTLPAILAVLRSWAVRFEQDYLAAQFFFEPYPKPLFDLSSSGTGRLV